MLGEEEIKRCVSRGGLQRRHRSEHLQQLREIVSRQSAEGLKDGSALIDSKREFDVTADAMPGR